MSVTRIDERYEVRGGLGRGAMGSVYLAWDPKIGREVAIKVLQEEYAKSPKHRQRFEREARAIAALKHPNIVEIYDYGGSPDAHLYLVMEYVRGQHLGKLVRQDGPFPPAVLAAAGLELCSALGFAHGQGVIHRDLKPENVFIDGGRVVLVDFGIVKAIAPENPLGAEAARLRTDIIGTPGFMAPEQLEQKPLDARTDLFALGALLYFLATGKLPFEAESPYGLLKQMKTVPPQHLRELRSDYPVGLTELVHACLALEPAARPASADEVRNGMRALLDRMGVNDARDLLARWVSDPRGFAPPPAPRAFREMPVTRDTQPDATVLSPPRMELDDTVLRPPRTRPTEPPRAKRSWARWAAGGALVVGLAITVGWLRGGDDKPAPAAAPEGGAQLEVRSRSPAALFVNGEARGKVPGLEPLELPAGLVRLELVSERHGKIVQTVSLEAGAKTVVEADWQKRRVKVRKR